MGSGVGLLLFTSHLIYRSVVFLSVIVVTEGFDNGHSWIRQVGEAVENWLSWCVNCLAVWGRHPVLILIPVISLGVALAIRYALTYLLSGSTKSEVFLDLPTDFAFLSLSFCLTSVMMAGKEVNLAVVVMIGGIFVSYLLISLFCGLTKESVFLHATALNMQLWWKNDKKDKKAGPKYFQKNIRPVWTARHARDEIKFELYRDLTIPKPDRRYYNTLLLALLLYFVTVTVLGSTVFKPV